MSLTKKSFDFEKENKIIVLNNELEQFDNQKSGLSIYLSFFGKKILLDLGVGDEVIENAKKIGLSLDNLDFIVLSHGHIDHTSGLTKLEFKEKTKLICHPVALHPKFFGEQKIGCPFSFESLKEKFHILHSKKPFWILEDKIVFLGQIPRKKRFSPDLFPGRLSNGKIDYCLDDSAIVVKTSKGLLIVTGCSHSGIENIIEYAKKVCSEEKIFAIFGGLHLINKQRTDEVLNFLEKENINKIYPIHCIDSYAVAKFKGKGYKKLDTLEEVSFR